MFQSNRPATHTVPLHHSTTPFNCLGLGAGRPALPTPLRKRQTPQCDVSLTSPISTIGQPLHQVPAAQQPVNCTNHPNAGRARACIHTLSRTCVRAPDTGPHWWGRNQIGHSISKAPSSRKHTLYAQLRAHAHTMRTATQEQSKKSGWRKLLRSFRAALDVCRSAKECTKYGNQKAGAALHQTWIYIYIWIFTRPTHTQTHTNDCEAQHNNSGSV